MKKVHTNIVRAAAVILLVFLSFMILKPFLISLFTAALLAYVFYPLYARIVKKTAKKRVSSLLLCLIIFLIIIIPSFLFMNILVQETYSLYTIGKNKLAGGVLEGCDRLICDQLKMVVSNPTFGVPLRNILTTFTNYLVSIGSSLLISIPSLVLNLFIMFFVLYYLFLDGPKVVKGINKLLLVDKDHRNQIFKQFNNVIKALVYGYLIIALAQGLAGALGFFVFGIPSPLFWGLMMALLALIPVVGAGLIWGIASIILVANGVFGGGTVLIVKGVLLFLYGFFIISGIENVLKPRLIGQLSGVNPAVIMLGIFGGVVFMGFPGIVFGPLILALMITTMDIYLAQKD